MRALDNNCSLKQIIGTHFNITLNNHLMICYIQGHKDGVSNADHAQSWVIVKTLSHSMLQLQHLNRTMV